MGTSVTSHQSLKNSASTSRVKSRRYQAITQLNRRDREEFAKGAERRVHIGKILLGDLFTSRDL
jgi:hypothetical protein